MARLVKNVVKPFVEAIFTFQYPNNTKKESVIREDELVYVSYIKNNELKELEGRVNRILFNRVSSNVSRKSALNFSTQYKITGIELDYSEENYSKLIKIDAKSIVEIHLVDAEMDAEKSNKQTVVGNLVVDVYTELSDGTSTNRTFSTGDGVKNLLYSISLQDKTVTGTITNITYRISDSSTNMNSSELKLIDTLTPDMLYVMTSNGSTLMVPIRMIKDVGNRQTTVTSVESIIETLSSVDDGDIVRLPSGEIVEQICISKNIMLCGANAGITAASGDRCNMSLNGETVISSISVSDGVSVAFDGLTFIADAHIQLKNSSEVVINNCKVFGLIPYTKKSHAIMLSSSELSSINITNCYFGTNPSVESSDMYHIFELTGYLTNNSTISNNYFAKGCCTQNIINIYGIEEGSRIFISRNVFEYSANAIRFGMKGSPECTIMMEKNTYYETDVMHPEYAGLFLIQPYGMQTESFENCTIICNNTKRNDNGQLFYLWYGESDTQITNSKRPTVYIDSRRKMYPTSEKRMDVVG